MESLVHGIELILVWLVVSLVWLVFSLVSAFLSSWFFLSERFRANERPVGDTVYCQVKRMGAVPESWVTHMVVSRAGLYLYVGFLYRFMHPPLLIPWSKVKKLREYRTPLGKRYEYDLARTTSLIVTKIAHEAIRKFRR